MASLIYSSFLHKSHQNTIVIKNNTRNFKNNQTLVPVARLFGPSTFEAPKLKVLFIGVDDKKHPGKLPRTYTLTHSDITSKLTLAISQTINISQLQGWYNKLYRDEVIAEWRKVKGNMSLHVHCHISGGHLLLDLCAHHRFLIFTKELPLVLKAFAYGDGNLLKNYPELQEALVWVYFHSNVREFNRVECWGPLMEASSLSLRSSIVDGGSSNWEVPKTCLEECSCCYPSTSSIPWSHDLVKNQHGDETNKWL
ncbi:protein STAY-GREEN 1, chloroplastic-like [Bidens hawaiensis]|uniref:protein STAY-GREEN 1, chloroplastic-like n=1 Tax=Bidens hawaiensis TaxID=980011 RepID=UPI004049C9D8